VRATTCGERPDDFTRGNEFHAGVLDDASTWSADLSAVSKPFVVLTAFDTTGLDDATRTQRALEGLEFVEAPKVRRTSY
jgi:hypothetical protein